MKYTRINTSDPVVTYAVKVLSEHLLRRHRVLWLLSGGSAIDIEVRIAQALQTLDVSRLTVGLVDERYGPPGHKDENHLQLMNAFFPIYIHPVLTGKSAEKMTKEFGNFIDEALDSADYSIGIFGIGSDGHTAGIKPHSPSVTAKETAIYYEWDDYNRITLTPQSIRRLDEAIIYANGKEKAETLRTLLHDKLPIAEQPAQILKEVNTSILFTDNDLHRA